MAGNGGAIEEVGQVAQEVVGGLKGSPALLAVIVLNVITIALIGWLITKAAENRHSQMMLLMDRCLYPNVDSYRSNKSDPLERNMPSH